MWIVRVALSRPYTFIVLALLILLAAPIAILRTPTDIFPNIDIPVISSIWVYTGLHPEEFEGRITSVYERVLTTTVNDIEHIESTTLNGTAVVKIFLQPYANVTTGIAQTTAVSQTILKQMPAGITPPIILSYSASSVPILQLALSGKGLQEQDLNDMALNFLRTQLVTVPGAVIPYPYGGKMRQIMVDLNPAELQAKGLSPFDVVTAVANQNLLLPSGTAKIGQFEYDVDMNYSPQKVEEIGNFPVKVIGNSTVYLRDVANIRRGFAPQTNIIRRDGQRGVLVSILKAGSASTLDVVEGIKKMLPRVAATLPPQLQIKPLADQSIFVRASISGVIREAVIAACLTGLMILLFLGSWRSTLIIAVSIPLSILTSILVLSALHETINIMTLGGLALAVGILVDDATVTIENIERYLEEGRELHDAILEGAAQIALPALVSTLCICIVFIPMFFLSGVAKYLFVPLAEAVVFAMLASYLWSRTIVPTLAMYLLSAEDEYHADEHIGERQGFFRRYQQMFERAFERFREAYHGALDATLARPKLFSACFLAFCVLSAGLSLVLGRDFFPQVDAGQIRLHMRARTGLGIEETARLADEVNQALRRTIPKEELTTVLDNIGIPYSGINLSYSNSGVIGTSDAEILIQLKRERRKPTSEYVRELREKLPQEFPGVLFSFQPADIVTQILNFGTPAPIDIEVTGMNQLGNYGVAQKLAGEIRHIPGATDVHVHQAFDSPTLLMDVDRTRAQSVGLQTRDIAQNLLVSLSSSFQTAPSFWLDPRNGVEYQVAVQAPQYRIDSYQALQNIPISGSLPGSPPQILQNLVRTQPATRPAEISHYNVQPMINLYASVDGRDLGSVSDE